MTTEHLQAAFWGDVVKPHLSTFTSQPITDLQYQVGLIVYRSFSSMIQCILMEVHVLQRVLEEVHVY